MIDILLVEDNQEIADLTTMYLKKAGYSVYHAESGEAALEFLKNESACLVLLDIMLPGIDGYAVCHAVRLKSNAPIIIISAKSQREDKLKGYELGADDYIEKPYDMELLFAKISALMSRSYKIDKEEAMIVSGGLKLDTRGRRVTLNGKELELGVKEYELLELLVKNVGKVLNKDYIFNKIWGVDSESENQTLTVHIKMLRDKIEDDKKNPARIKTVWGIGYRYEEV